MMDSDYCWLAGLTDGEGCFSLIVKRGGPGGRHKRIEFTYKVALRADDAATLVEAQRILGCGTLSQAGVEGRAAGGLYRGHALTQLHVNTRSGVARIIEVFRAAPLRSKKARDFAIWAAAFEAFTGYIHSVKGFRGKPRKQFKRIPEELFTMMEVYRQQIREVRRYQPQLAGTTT